MEKESPMHYFQLDQTFQTGHATVDAQHEKLVGIVNAFGELMMKEAAGSDEVDRVIAELVDYTRYHFVEEEHLMVTSGLDRRHCAQHRQQHEDLFNEIGVLQTQIDPGEQDSGKRLFEFLVNWLVFHILGTDMLMARQIEAVRQGKSAAEAYRSEEQESRTSTDLLLRAVKSLLLQISSRNRQLAELNETLEKRVRERTLDLTAANRKLQELASTDGLTGALNRRVFMEEAGNMLQLARRYDRPLALLMIDADHFKRINDTHGHHAGDKVLVQISRTMQQSLRGTDRIGRIGGEEFAVLLPETDQNQAADLAERLLKNIRAISIQVETAHPIRVTVSIGIANLLPQTANIGALLSQADAALYRAKTSGRDRWCIPA
jgi:hemerythrin